MPSITARPDDAVTKRQRLDGPKSGPTARASRIFAPYRTLGLVSPTDVPFTAIALGKTTFQITTSVGRCLHTYDLRKGLNLVFITRPQTPASITATTAWKDRVFAAWGGSLVHAQVGIWVFKRGKRIAELEIPLDLAEPVRQFLIFGSWMVGCCTTRLEVWRSSNYEHYTTLMPSNSGKPRSDHTLSGTMCNVPTLLNKILVGKQNGCVELWNLSTGKLVYTIAPRDVHTGAVTALQPSPALTVVAIAREDGSVVVHDVRFDKEIIRLNSKSSRNLRITSISFRTDGFGAGDDGRKAGVMASSCADDGDVTLWNLNNGGRVMGILRGAHNAPASDGSGALGGITKAEFLPGQPVLVTSGCDNSLKSWIFDETPFSPVPRILHSRGGHAAPATRLQFLPAEADGADSVGKWLLSSGRDQSLWGWSLRRDGQSTELSQGNVRKKARKLGLVGNGMALDDSTSLADLRAPEITFIACSLNRDGGMGSTAGGGPVWTNSSRTKQKNGSDVPISGWESIVTAHKNDKYARTWFWGRKKAGRWIFATGDGGEVKSVAITPCGTFALVGSAGGGIDMFNLQSGIHRQRFPCPLTPLQAKQLKARKACRSAAGDFDEMTPKELYPHGRRHTKDVTGIIVDSLNRTVISCSLDGNIKFWDFSTGKVRHELDWYPMTAITAVRYHRPSDLIALSCDDLSIRVVDIETRKLVRELWGCVGHVSDFCFSNDGRWIIAASMDSVIRVWDLPTGHLIDAVRIEGACTAIAFSTTGEFLATAHADGPGINIWTNRSLFTHVSTRHIDEAEIAPTALPTSSGERGEGPLAAAFESESVDDWTDDIAPSSTDQLSQDMTTLSLVPRSRWQTLLHFDNIAQRNKPIEPPKKPEKAPFFLPSLEKHTVPAAPPATLPGSAPDVPQESATAHSRISKATAASIHSTTTTLLQTAHTTQNYTPFLTHLSALSPAATDIAIRVLTSSSSASALGPTTSAHTDPSQTPTTNLAATFVAALTVRLRQKRDYELVQAWMAVFLRVHAGLVAQDVAVRECLGVWRVEQEREARRLGALVGYCVGVVGFLRSGR